jgi:transposase
MIEVPMDLYPRSRMPQNKEVQHLIGVDFPPITTAQIKREDEDGVSFIMTVLVDGAHRMLATELEGDEEIDCYDLGLMEEHEVRAMAIKENARHGKQLSMTDKQKLAKAFAADGLTVREIVSTLSVGERTVSRWVAEAKEKKKSADWKAAEKIIKAGGSVSAAAKDVGVSRSTLQGWVKSPPKPATRPTSSPAQLKDNTANVECPDRVDALAAMVITDAKDIAKELDDTCWAEIVIAVTAKLVKALPKEWKE